jgi:hypothetical protein
MKPAKQLNTGHMLAFAGAALLLVLAIIWQLIAFAREQPDASQFPIIVGVIALVGTVLTGAVTFAGLLLKDSVDRRSALQQAESEKRLRMETALKAVELISRAEVDGAPIQESREAAIMVISSLDQDRLALGLAEQFWNRDKISTAAFVDVVEQCLNTDNEDLKDQCCKALYRNYNKLITDSNAFEFPYSFCYNWNGKLSFPAKHDLAITLVKIVISKAKKSWNIGSINAIIYILYKMFVNDPDPRFRYITATFAKNLCDAAQPSPDYCMLPADMPELAYNDVRRRANAVIDGMGAPQVNLSQEAGELSAQIGKWRLAAVASRGARQKESVSDGNQ